MPKRNSLFHAHVGRTDAGSIRITIRARKAADQYNRYRDLAVCVYTLAAEMERRSEKLGADWVVSPQVFDSRIDLEIVQEREGSKAARFVAEILADLGLT